MDKKKMMEKWAKLSPAQRQFITIGGAFGAIAIVAALFVPSSGQQPVSLGPKKEASSTNLVTPAVHDTSAEQTAATVQQLKGQMEKQEQETAVLRAQNDELKTKVQQGGGQSNDVAVAIAALSSKIDEMKRGQQGSSGGGNGLAGATPSFGDALPAPGGSIDPLPGQTAQTQPTPGKPVSKLAIVGGKSDAKEDEEKKEEEHIPYLAAGSFFDGILVNGMDAPTSSVTAKNPVPALVRVKGDAFMANRFKMSIRECFVIVSGFGVMATERAQLRTESLTCIREDGQVIEGKLDGYVVGEDGKVGMRGRLVSRQGSMLAKSLMAGFLSGLSQNLVPSPVQSMNINPGNAQQWQSPNVGAAATSGLYKGASDSAKMLSQYYLEMAKDAFPVVEIDAARRMTIVLTRGVELTPSSERVK